MNCQMTPAATKLIASGTKIDRLGDRLVADAVDEDRDQQPEADRAAVRKTSQITLLRRASSVSRSLKNQT